MSVRPLRGRDARGPPTLGLRLGANFWDHSVVTIAQRCSRMMMVAHLQLGCRQRKSEDNCYVYGIATTDHPWIARLDHLICKVPNIQEAMDLFVDRHGFPEAWPIGPFWPNALTSGVALGGLNLEFVEPLLEEERVTEASIRTIVFEPTNLDYAIQQYERLNFPMELREKWEADPELLRLRGFDNVDEPQLICRTLVPTGSCEFDFFLCDYSPSLKHRLAPTSFSVDHPVAKVLFAGPVSAKVFTDRLVPMGNKKNGSALGHVEGFAGEPEVVEIVSDRGPLDLQGWPARFRFT